MHSFFVSKSITYSFSAKLPRYFDQFVPTKNSFIKTCIIVTKPSTKYAIQKPLAYIANVNHFRDSMIYFMVASIAIAIE